MKLSKRLQAIENYVSENAIVADIGTDHGYIPVSLIENGKAKKVIATDISKGSLDKTVEFVKDLRLEDKIDTRLGDGLQVIKPYEVDTLIIAGMGGLLIMEILESNLKTLDSIVNFIFQPMVASRELRQYLVKNSFSILDEDLVYEDKKYYEIIYAQRGKTNLVKEIDFEINPLLIAKGHPLVKDFIKYKIKGGENILDELSRGETDKSIERYKLIEESLQMYREVLKKVDS